MVHPSRGKWRRTRGRENILVADMSHLGEMKKGASSCGCGAELRWTLKTRPADLD